MLVERNGMVAGHKGGSHALVKLLEKQNGRSAMPL